MLALIDESVTRDHRTYAGTGLGPVQVRSAHFSLAISRALGSVVVAVHGNLDVPGTRHLGSVLADIIDGQGNLAVIIDLHDATALDARDLSVLATAAERAGRKGVTVTLADPPDELHEPLALLGLARLVHIAHHERRRPSPSAGSVGPAADAEWPWPPDAKASPSAGSRPASDPGVEARPMTGDRSLSHEDLLTLARKTEIAAREGDRSRLGAAALGLREALLVHLDAERPALLQLPVRQSGMLLGGQQRLVDLLGELGAAGTDEPSRCGDVAQLLVAKLTMQADAERRSPLGADRSSVWHPS